MDAANPLVILVTGPINAGKTAVGRALCRLLHRTAHVEVDALRGFVEWMPLEESIPLNLKNAASVGANFLAYGLNVVVSYPLDAEDYHHLKERFREFPTYCFVLSPPLEVAQDDRGGRVLSKAELERIAFHYESGIASPDFGIVIDNSNQTIEETARGILETIDAGEAVRSPRSFYDEVYEMVRRIPKGRVTTYGHVAALCGKPRAARTVGWALHALRDDSDVPWQRVINRRGGISISKVGLPPALQRALLEVEGVRFRRDGTVDLRRYGWRPEA